jgi:hypothetical protein
LPSKQLVLFLVTQGKQGHASATIEVRVDEKSEEAAMQQLGT